MKNLRKILLSLFFGILINTSAQSITFGHGVLSAFSIFTSVMADSEVSGFWWHSAWSLVPGDTFWLQA